MRWSFVLLTFATACSSGPEPAVPTPATTAVPTPEPTPTLWPIASIDPDVGKNREALLAAYRLPLDRRFVLAFAALEEVATGGPPPDVSVTFEAGWKIDVAGETAGTLIADAGFDDALTLLTARATRANLALPPGKAAMPRFDGLEAPFEVLERLDSSWSAGTRDLAHVRAAARGLALASLQLRDELHAADPIAARALALLAVLRAHGDSADLETTLLAAAMGYGAASDSAAAKLPKTEPLRWFVLGDDKTLEALAKNGTGLGGLLWLSRLADRRESGAFLAYQKRCCQSSAARIPALAMQEDLGFGQSAASQQAAIHVSLIEAATWAGEDKAAAAAALQERRVAIRFEEWVSRPPSSTGMLVGPEPRRAYLRASFENAVVRTFRHVHERLSSPAAVTGLLEALGPDAPGKTLLGELAYISMKTRRSADELHTRLSRTELRGALAVDLYKTFAESIPNGPSWRSGLKAVAARLDSRPRDREDFHGGFWPTTMLPVLEAHASILAAQAPRRFPGTEIWLAKQRWDGAALERIATAPGISPYHRIQADISRLEAGLGDPVKIRKHIDDVLASAPTDTAAVNLATEHLIEKREYKLSDKILQRTLRTFLTKKGLGDTGLSEFAVRTKIADLALLQGRCADAWKVIEPGIGSYTGGVLTRGAYSLACLGRREEALGLTKRATERYPGAASEFATARTLWLLGDYEAAGRHLHLHADVLHQEWNQLGRRFHQDHARKTKAARLDAFRKLVAAELPAVALLAFATEEAAAGSAKVAFEYVTTRDLTDGFRVTQLIRGYQYRKRMKNESDAIDWIRKDIERLPPGISLFDLDTRFFLDGVPELALLLHGDLEADPKRAVHHWDIRALLAMRRGPPYPDNVRKYLLEAPMNEDTAAGRYMLDMDMPLETLFELTKASSPGTGNLAAMAFHLGEHADVHGNLSDAAVWHSMALELTGPGSFVHERMSRQRLGHWANAPPKPPVRKPLATQKKGTAQRR